MPRSRDFLSLLSGSQEAARRGDLATAARYANEAAAVASQDPAELAQAAIALAKTGQMLSGHRLLGSLRVPPDRLNPEALQWMAAAMHALKCYQSALAYARAARRAADPAGDFFCGTLELFCGHAEEAEDLLESCLRSAPDMASAHWTIAKLARQTPGHNHVDRLRRQLRKRSPGDTELPYLWFALFKELDDIGETADAWQALVQGCLSWRRMARYDLERDIAGMEGLAHAFPAYTPLAQPTAKRSSRPVFIVGLPRSGTTLVERILAGHSAIHASGELDELAAGMILGARGLYFDIPNAADAARIASTEPVFLAQTYLDNTAWRAGTRPVFTDKRPNNFLYIGAINRAMPQARVIHVHKQPMAGCFSLLKEFFGGRYNYSYRLNELAAYHDGYRRLMQHWRDSGHEFLDVPYERLIADPEAEARKIVEYCELDWDEECLRTDRREGEIASASVIQARAPVSSQYSEAWRRYAIELEPLRDLLAV